MPSIGIVGINSHLYPRELRSYKDGVPPSILYVMPPVDLGTAVLIGVVGTRDCSEWGRRTAYEVGRLITKHGFWVVTGLAECIDASVARGILDAGGIVVGVRPWLKPFTLPYESKMLWWDHRDRVVLVAENYRRPEGHHSHLYYMRNRLIAGMSKLVVVVEAKPWGGTTHMVEWALKRGKPLAIFEHPDRESIYYRGYRKFLKKARKLEKARLYVVKSLREFERIIKKLRF